MFKRQSIITVILMAATSLATEAAYADLFSFQTNTPAAQTPPPGSSAPTLSANDFKAKVAAKAQQEQKSLSQQTLSSTKDDASQLPLPNAAPKPPKLNQQQSAPTTPQTTQSSSPQPLVIGVPEEDKTQATTTTAAPQPAQPAASASSPSFSGGAAAAPPPAQSQIYTGFGGGTSNSTSAPSSQSGGGWNIKY